MNNIREIQKNKKLVILNMNGIVIFYKDVSLISFILKVWEK